MCEDLPTLWCSAVWAQQGVMQCVGDGIMLGHCRASTAYNNINDALSPIMHRTATCSCLIVSPFVSPRVPSLLPYLFKKNTDSCRFSSCLHLARNIYPRPRHASHGCCRAPPPRGKGCYRTPASGGKGVPATCTAHPCPDTGPRTTRAAEWIADRKLGLGLCSKPLCCTHSSLDARLDPRPLATM